jgi:hypothetical protein
MNDLKTLEIYVKKAMGDLINFRCSSLALEQLRALAKAFTEELALDDGASEATRRIL